MVIDRWSPRRIRSLLLLVAACAYALVAASTTPFTEPANVLTGIPVVAMLVMVVIRWPLRTRTLRTDPPTANSHPYRLWVVVLAAFVAWELYNYLAPGTRASHPTFSSMTDAVDRYYGLKALLFLIWLSLGWAIVQRGSKSRPKAAA